jgi:peptide/nickel transport system substrate-binding protein
MDVVRRSVKVMRLKRMSALAVLAATASLIALTVLAACGGTETVIQTVVVKEEVAVEKVVTVEVEKEVVVQGETVVQTVQVEKQVVVEKEVTPTPDPGALRDVPRNRTLVITHWSDSYRTQHDNVENFNWWLPGNSHARHASEKGLVEYLFYTNLNEGNIIPWLGESYEYNDSLDSIDVKIREGASWSDGVAFTAHDVKFTIDMVRENAPDLNRSTLWADMISSVEVHDDYNLTINLSRPDPRFFQVQFGFGWENHVPIVPKHVWENEDPLTFSNYDAEKGWPLGTGAYRLSLSTPEVQIYDLRDDWWATETGFADRPEVERIQYIPVANDDIAGQLYINNQLDAGPPLLKGTFEAAKGFNDALRSWNFEGPVWGAPDGCNFVLILNNQKEHFSSADVRWAINHAINRDEITGLAYEGGVPSVVVPISSYGVKQYLPLMQDILDKYNADEHSLEKVDDRMTTAGYSKDSEGFWNKDGSRVEITLEIPSWMRPQGPFLEKQLQDGGFDAVFKQGEPATIGDRLRMGETEVVWVQCGSINEPYDTFKSYHSKNSAPPGENYAGAVQGGRYENPEMDAILDEMEAMLHSPDDPRYVELARQAMDLFLRDMPVIHIAEELHVIVHNTHYWTGWPGVEDPYVAPYPPWNGWYMITLNLEPTGN